MTGLVVWFTGLPSSGKTTLAREVRDQLLARNLPCCLLDSDEVRDALTPPPGYDPAGRDAFYATLASLAALLARQGLTALVAATAHRKAHREQARTAAPKFIEVYVDTPLEECERRDTKGLYRSARAGEITGMPGLQVAYEAPTAPLIVARGGSSNSAARDVVAAILSGQSTQEGAAPDRDVAWPSR